MAQEGFMFAGHDPALRQGPGAAKGRVVAAQDLAQGAGGGQGRPQLPGHGREVAGADDAPALAVRAEEGDGGAVRVVHVQPLEALPAVVPLPEGGLVLIEVVQGAGPGLQLVVALIVQQKPVQGPPEVPLDELPELPAHEQQLLPRMAYDISVEGAEVGEFLVIVPGHFVQHTALAVDHLVMAEREDEVLGKSVEHGEGQLVVAALAPEGVQLHVVQGIVHEAHVPFKCEAQTALLRRGGDPRVGCALLGDGDGPPGFRQGVDLPQQLYRAQVDVPAVAVAPEIAAPAIAQVQHTAHRVHPQPVDVVAVQEQGRGGFQEAADDGAFVVEDQGPPVGMGGHPGVLPFIGGGAVEVGKAEGVPGEVGGHPVHENADPPAVQGVHQIHEVLGRAVARRGREISGGLVAPGFREGELRQG